MDRRAETPEQKRAIIERLYAAWLAHPELRLGQFIANKVNTVAYEDFGRHLFYMEDESFIEEIEDETVEK